MLLTDTHIKAAKPREKDWKLADEKGLYLLVRSSGSKLWRLKFRHFGKEKKLALGAYPEVGLKEARRQRDLARASLETGADPALQKRKAKLSARLRMGQGYIATFAFISAVRGQNLDAR